MPTFTPEITQAYQNDPRTKLAQNLLASGANTGPTAGGKWAWVDGIARALSGAAGGYAAHKQDQKYEKREHDMTDAVASALAGGAGGAAGPGGVAPPQGVQQAQPPAPAMVPPPPQNNPQPDPLAALPGGPPQGGAPVAPQGVPAPPPPQPPMGAPTAPQGAPTPPPAAPMIAAALAGGRSAANPADPFGPKPRVQGANLVQAMIPITGATESNHQDYYPTGKPVTSSKGAKYEMQVMPATARKPGFGIKPAANDTPEEYNRVGKELLGKLTAKYGGDPAKGWAAYNGGTGRVDHAIAKHGDNWLAAMPKETRDYVAKNTAALGGTGATPAADNFTPAPQEALLPTGPTQYQTAAPAMPEVPGRPADRPAAQSLSLDASKKLLAMRDPAMFERAMKMMDTGMGEQFTADREALAEQNSRDDTDHKAGVDDAYYARQQQRSAAYDARGREQQENYATGREMRGYAHDDNTLGRTQQFQHGENALTRAATASEGALDRAATSSNIDKQIEGKHEDAQTKAAQKFQNYLSTPQGSRIYQESTNRINNLGDITNQIGAFEDLNAKTNTGGYMLNVAPGTARVLSSGLQQMDAITQKIAPLMRQAGQGSMSDKDLAGFVRSVPNIQNTRAANSANAQRLRAGIQRMQDFEMGKLQAASEGRQVEFLHEWNTYKNSVPFDKGLSFDDWKASVPQYGADGKRK